MKEWWINLSLREKQTASIGIVLLVLFLFYKIIWSPLTTQVDNLRNNIHRNQALLSWMKEASQRITKLEKNANVTIENSTSILGITQNEINNTPFAQQVSGLRQAENDSVQFTLQKVSFDSLISWLTKLSQSHGLVVLQASTKPSDKPGMVSAEIILQRSHLS